MNFNNLKAFIEKAKVVYGTFDDEENLLNFLINNTDAIQKIIKIDEELFEVGLNWEYDRPNEDKVN